MLLNDNNIFDLIDPFHHGCNGKSSTVDFAQKSNPHIDLSAVDGCLIPGRSSLFPPVLTPTVRRRRTKRGHVVPMGTIITRKRKDGTEGHTAQIVIKKGGLIVHREAQTFDRKQAASAWLDRREKELARPGALERKEDPPLSAVIDRYIAESKKEIGRTKAQVLNTIKKYEIADLRCSKITSADLISFAQSLPVAPQTVQNYLSHLSAIFRLARPAWDYPLDYGSIQDAFVVAKKLGVTSKGRSRNRRPSLEELDLLMENFSLPQRRGTVPMHIIVPFAIFSTRRQEEITRIAWADYEKSRVMVRDMKHPGDKIGNDTWCDLTPEASAIIESMPKVRKQIFPFNSESISAAFTRACQLLGIEDLRFHDLRHEGASLLIERGLQIPQAQKITGHRSWTSLQRYSHLRQTGDKYENWKWKKLWQ